MNGNNDISNLSLFTKLNLLENCNTKRVETEKYIVIIENLKELFKKYNFEFIISNNVIRHILIIGDISDNWSNDIVIYLRNNNNYFSKCINLIEEDLILKNINIIEKTDKKIKFLLNILNKEYIFVIKEYNLIVHYKYYFEINQLEYDLMNDNIINRRNNTSLKIQNNKILNLRNLDFFSEIQVITTKYDAIINYLVINPIVIFELLELVVNFLDYLTVIEIKNFFLNLNKLLHKRSNFFKSIKNVIDNDDDFVFYKELIKFSYNLEEKGLFGIYIKYLIENYKLLIDLIINLDIDKELFKIFDITYFREFCCLLVFQHLIYNKRRIFREKKKKTTNDLLESFIKENDSIKSEDEIKQEQSDFNMLDKNKFTSLKYLKEIGKEFPKFEGLLKMFFLPLNDEVYIKNFYNLMMLLFMELKDTKKHHSLKLAYIIKRFHFASKELLVKVVIIFNSIIKNKEYNSIFLINDNFIDIITSKKLNDYIYKKMTQIPKINENFKNNIDCIDIIDFQDTFILFLEFVYKNKKEYKEDELGLLELFDTIFEASLCDMRSYRIFKNEKRRKKVKKLKKEKKQMKEMKKSKFKIVKNTLKEQIENKMEESESSDIDEEKLQTPELDILVKKVLEEDNQEGIENLGEVDELLDTFLTD